MTFARFVAVDWSGAKSGGRGGIAVAECMSGSTPPRLVSGPRRGQWQRRDVVRWLSSVMADGRPVLVGLDFAFAFPWNEPGGYFPGVAVAADGPQALWALIEDVATGDPGLYAGAFVDDHLFQRFFWTGRTPSTNGCSRFRATERHCRDMRFGAPETIFKLVGPKQVGKASLSGMRGMHRLKAAHGDALGVWPFDGTRAAAMVCVEIFSRLFLTRAGVSVKKVRGIDDVNRVLTRFGSDPLTASARMFTDHETDAMISAVALRALSADREVWTPAAMTARDRRYEGWIFGVR